MTQLEKMQALPFDTAFEVMNALLDYDEVMVIHENGKTEVHTSFVLSSSYAKDRKHLGTFTAKELYQNEKERTALRRMRDTHTERIAEMILNQKNRPSCNHDLLKVAIDLKSYEW